MCSVPSERRRTWRTRPFALASVRTALCKPDHPMETDEPFLLAVRSLIRTLYDRGRDRLLRGALCQARRASAQHVAALGDGSGRHRPQVDRVGTALSAKRRGVFPPWFRARRLQPTLRTARARDLCSPFPPSPPKLIGPLVQTRKKYTEVCQGMPSSQIPTLPTAAKICRGSCGCSASVPGVHPSVATIVRVDVATS